MADVRNTIDVVLSDATTKSQQAAVDASGRLSVSLTASSATVTVDTELPAAAALADATANPTVPAVGAFAMGYNGTTWDRLRSSTANGLVVDVSRVQGTVTVDSELPAAAALADAAANPTTPTVGSANLIFNGTTWDRQKEIVAALDSAGVGIATAGIVAQLDDVSTATVTENQFAPVRLSARRALLVEGVASGTNVNVNLAASAATVTVDSELPAASALADATANPTVPAVGSFLMGWNGATWDRLKSSTANGLQVDVTRLTGTVTVDSELPAAAALADATANPTVPGVGGFLMGYNGATWDRVRTANTGRLQVDVITGGGTDTPSSPVANYNTAAGVSAGSTSNHDSASQTSATTKLTKVIVSASVAFKAEVQNVSNTVATTMAVGFGQAGTTLVLEPPLSRSGRNYWSVAFSGAGTNVWRVIRTNQDVSEAADLYSTMFYES